MPNSQLLNYQFHQTKQAINQPTLVFIHGLFGDMNNLGVIARAFSDNYSILRVDLRNHGQSFHSESMNYDLMAEDVFALIQHLKLEKVILIGHSMGGKTSMKLTALHPEIVEKLIVIDIAPIVYGNERHQDVFKGLFSVKNATPRSRQAAKPILEREIQDPAVVQFMLKSFEPGSPEFFRFNLTALFNNYPHLMDWQSVQVDTPTLFIKGGDSSYIKVEDTARILEQFPNATSFTVNGCGHWVHAEKPEFVIRAINRFLNKN
ncbi:alpha/beta fold hydrolase [Rodentibacter haemolyticus]|uniref:Alpha/beta fold hydrolase n=1 Tax=Rodentibacter haemolyticus TaxID=2778911 RepID=A0ABX6V0S9_9PAST|nr:alpha/beta fold hydrolase [Rodentibacter haemolyticus]QPB43218.1 alpha/beta fold hydrolase [Rodentibacter haemolyticus]